MAIIRFNPLRDMWPFRDEIGRFQQDMMNRFWGKNGQEGDLWHPSIDLSETTEAYQVKAELPGVRPDEINIEVHDDVVTITGERKEEKASDKEDCHIREMSYGKFTRSVRLPMPIDADKVKAKFDDGVLKVTLPKTEKTKPKRIEIEK